MDAKKFVTTLGFLTGLGAIGAGLYLFYKKQVGLILQYCYKIEKVDILSFSKDRVKAVMHLKIKNKSSFLLKIFGYRIVFFIMGKKVAETSSDKEQGINNNSVSVLKVPFEFIPGSILNPDDVKNLVLFYFMDKKLITFNIIGKIKAGVNFLAVNIPLDISINLKEAMSTDSSDDKVKTKCNL
jgi:LEA14-like dessication related protein